MWMATLYFLQEKTCCYTATWPISLGSVLGKGHILVIESGPSVACDVHVYYATSGSDCMLALSYTVEAS